MAPKYKASMPHHTTRPSQLPPKRKRKRKGKESVKALRSMPYVDYLRTQHWKRLRKLVLGRWLGYCEWCGGAATQVHHLTYIRRGHEQMQDLVPLCLSCHAGAHTSERPMR